MRETKLLAEASFISFICFVFLITYSELVKPFLEEEFFFSGAADLKRPWVAYSRSLILSKISQEENQCCSYR